MRIAEAITALKEALLSDHAREVYLAHKKDLELLSHWIDVEAMDLEVESESNHLLEELKNTMRIQ